MPGGDNLGTDSRTVISPMQSSTQQIYDWLLGRILRGELLPGTRLSEVETAAHAGISRQPVREAFIRLTAAGLAEVRPQRGTYIGRISIRAVLAGRMVREAVESDLIRMLSTRISDDTLAQLRGQINLQRDASARQDIDGFIKLDDEFHYELARAAGHPEVWDVLEGLKSPMNRLRYLTAQIFDHSALITQHMAIVEALGLRDGDQADAAMRMHLRQLLDDLPEITGSRPELFSE